MDIEAHGCHVPLGRHVPLNLRRSLTTDGKSGHPSEPITLGANGRWQNTVIDGCVWAIFLL